MPTVTFGPGVNSSPVTLFESFEFIGSVPMTSLTPTQIVFTNGVAGLTYILTGTGFTAGPSGLTGGTITGVEIRFGGVTQATITGLNLLAIDAQAAVADEIATLNSSAIEDLFLPLGFVYVGNANDDVLLSTSVSVDGVSLNFSGNDKFEAGGGNDNIWLGDGNDTGVGGTGNDTFEGGTGNDQLQGDAGGDRLQGQAGSDTLAGGSGLDRLDGGTGRDKIIGGTGNDTMTGGAGPDTFVFKAGDGVDRVTGFNLADDRIDLPNAATTSFVSVNGGADTLVNYGTLGDQILLVGVAFADHTLITFV